METTIYVDECDVRSSVIRIGNGVAEKTSGYPDLIENEINILKKIGYHPNIVQFIHVVENGFAMTGVKYGLNLYDYCITGRHHLISREAFDAKSCIDMIIQVSKGLSYLHNLNIIHHDLKDKNILVDNVKGKYKLLICDFGLSEIADENGFGNFENRGNGTQYSIAPEQHEQIKITNKIDIYAFGGICNEIVMKGRTSQEFFSHFPYIARLTYLCQDRNPDVRPTISEILDLLIKISDILM